MKYLVMICRGHVPMNGNRVNEDVEPFLKCLLPPGTKLNHQSRMAVVRQLHLAFKGMRVDEVYAVLMAHLIAAINRYDPQYTDKVKLVVETINHELSQQQQFSVADVGSHLGIDCSRYIRLLCRKGYLATVAGSGREAIMCTPRPPAGNASKSLTAACESWYSLPSRSSAPSNRRLSCRC